MSNIPDHNNLYAAEEWEVIFNAFRNVSIQSFDYDSVYRALDTYIQTNNPEEYDTYIKNGVMSTHLELISSLAHSIAFRVELTTRENFFDTAERRESVIKLAKAFSYRPKRNRAANGLLKVTGIRTTEPLFDSNGNSISNTTIQWAQVDDANWVEKFNTILNQALTPTNPIGRPVKRESIYNVQNDIYSIEKLSNTEPMFRFNANVNGVSRRFEAISCKIDDGIITESLPDISSNFEIVYRNDRNGNLSPSTGFFVYFKEGTLQSQNFLFDDPIINRTVDLEVNNINETDVWVTEVDESGRLLHEWVEINSLYGQQKDFEQIFQNNNRIYTTESLNNNQVRILFGDGENGRIPKGRFRIWYRTSLNEQYDIKRNEIRNVPVTIPYIGSDGQLYQLTVHLTNMITLSNADDEESLDEIKANAPLSHYAQSRMINAEDYNVFPKTQSSLIKKIKTVNRTHPGHSRHMDIYDPQEEISHVVVRGDDGYIMDSDTPITGNINVEFNTNFRNTIDQLIPTITNDESFKNHYYLSVLADPITLSDVVLWKTLPSKHTSNRGYFEHNGVVTEVGSSATINEMKFIREGSIIKFSDGSETFVTSITNNGIVNPFTDSLGNIILDSDIIYGVEVSEIVPYIRTQMSDSELDVFESLMEDNQSFSVFYDEENDEYNSSSGLLVVEFQFNNVGDFGEYDYESPGITYLIGSNNNVRFFFNGPSELLDPRTFLPIQDIITISSSNSRRSSEAIILDESGNVLSQPNPENSLAVMYEAIDDFLRVSALTEEVPVFIHAYSASIDDTVRKIDPDGNEVWSFTGHTSNVYGVAVDGNGYVYSGSSDGTVRKIDPNGNEVWTFNGHSGSNVYAVAVDNNGNVYSGSNDQTVRKIDPNGNEVWSFTGNTSIVRDVTVDNNGNVYSGANDTTVRKIDPNGNEIWSFTGHTGIVWSVAVDGDGNVYTGSTDETARKLDSSGNEIWSFTGHTNDVRGVDVDINGNVYTGSGDFTVRKLDSSGNEIWSFTGHTNWVYDVAVDNDGNVYSGSQDKTVRKIDPNGNEVWSFTGHTKIIWSIAAGIG